jgi:uncharacterized protein (TIGR02145 family)
MKNRNSLFFLVTIIAFIVFNKTICAQVTFRYDFQAYVNINDSVVLKIGEYVGESIQWQISYDQEIWINIPGAETDTLLFVADSTSLFRAEVIAGDCDPFYSEIILIHVIGDTDLDGQPCVGTPTFTDPRDGIVYNTVWIGDKCWMRENLKWLPDDFSYNEESSLIEPQYFVYDYFGNDINEAISTENYENYGALYNWTASTIACPTGWQLPEYSEILGLRNYLINEYENINSGNNGNFLKSCRQVDSPLGGICATTDHPRWEYHNNHYGTDNFSFSLLPGGSYYSTDGSFNFIGEQSNWWTKTEDDVFRAYCFGAASFAGNLVIFPRDKDWGYYVRCVKKESSQMTLPEVLTSEVHDVLDTTATSGGTVIKDGGSIVISRGVVWATFPDPTIENHEGITTDGISIGSFESHLNNLTPFSYYYLRAYATNSLGTEYGNQIFFKSLNSGIGEPCPEIETVTDIDDNVYNTVLIGNQCWMRENLKTTKYNNGTPIDYPDGNNNLWQENLNGAYAWYQNDTSWKEIYGALYNWYAVYNENKLCPDGWSVPQLHHYMNLLYFLGGWEVAGGKLKSTRTEPESHPRWNSPNTEATNFTNFSGYPGGYRHTQGDYFNKGIYGWWWLSDSLTLTSARQFTLHNHAGGSWSFLQNKNYGMSVRCIKDDYSDISPPGVSTASITDITATTAISGGFVYSDGDAHVLERGVLWSRDVEPTIDIHEGISIDGNGLGEFTSNIFGLVPDAVYYVRAYATNSSGTGYGEQLQFTTDNSGGFVCGTSTVTDIDGNIYNTVLIGNQCWLKENLKTTHYNNGIAIEYPGDNNYLWQNNTTGAYAWFQNDTIWKNSYGALYNWYTITSENPLCPTDWHVSSDSDWTVLTDFLGGEELAGGKLKSTLTEPDPHPRWRSPNTNATNESSFSGLPGALRTNDGSFGFIGNNGNWWSINVQDAGYYRSLAYINGNVYTYIVNFNYGLSIRCVRNF